MSRRALLLVNPHARRGQEQRFVYTRRPGAINTDGEITTYTPAKFRVIPNTVGVFVPHQPDSTASPLESAG